jgi:hypothetical protein
MGNSGAFARWRKPQGALRRKWLIHTAVLGRTLQDHSHNKSAESPYWVIQFFRVNGLLPAFKERKYSAKGEEHNRNDECVNIT